ncbi:MAG: HPr family phosphocarrier protein [Planctomycetota bacterium]|nr:HPr family phosphocarrier protein [Planctomycetota bacterium]MDA1178576.1 HPr family phosphocarrier protein [Planctomycetota bacterium]
MGEETATRTVTVINPQGVHARPADLFVKLASQYSARIQLQKGREQVDGKSILGILTLAAEQGSQLIIGATGPDADEALMALAALVEDGFHEGDVDRTPGGAPPKDPTNSD